MSMLLSPFLTSFLSYIVPVNQLPSFSSHPTSASPLSSLRFPSIPFSTESRGHPGTFFETICQFVSFRPLRSIKQCAWEIQSRDTYKWPAVAAQTARNRCKVLISIQYVYGLPKAVERKTNHSLKSKETRSQASRKILVILCK